MELVYALKELWRLRVFVAIAALVAVVAGLAVAYRISFDPPALHSKRTVTYGTASTQILVDAQNSAIVDLRYDLLPLVARAGVLARLTTTGEVDDALTRQLGLPPNSIDIAGTTVNPTQLYSGANQSANQPLGGQARYRVKADTDGILPVINISTRAPTAGQAVTLANATFLVLSKVVTNAQAKFGTPATNGVRLTQLGRAKGSLVNTGASKLLAAIVALLVLVGGLIVVWGAPRLAQAWRRTDSRGLVPAHPAPNGKPADGREVVEEIVEDGNAIATGRQPPTDH